jgi:glucose/arabinose dehydrogenase
MASHWPIGNRTRRTLCLSLILAAALAVPGTGIAEPPQPGDTYKVELDKLPKLGQTPSVSLPSETVVRPPDHVLSVPSGYKIELLTDALPRPRNLLALPDGGIAIALSETGEIAIWQHGKLRHFADGFLIPYGLAFHDNAIWVADLEAVWKMDWQPEATMMRTRTQVTPTGALGNSVGHITRSLAFAPDGKHFYVGVGSSTNLAIEAPPRATILEFSANGLDSRVFASGMRNPVGIAWDPDGKFLWAVVNERDHQGDEMVPDYLTHVTGDGFYGWPYAWLGPHPQPGFADRAPDLVTRTIAPDLLFKAHSAPLGLTFWHGDAFVALHGSWNRSHPQGYFVARIPFAKGRPVGGYQAFATGFILEEKQGQAQVWGRPVGLAVGTDDALYICDDVGGTLWRVTRQ